MTLETNKQKKNNNNNKNYSKIIKNDFKDFKLTRSFKCDKSF